MASSTVEDYIKHIYLISEKSGQDQVAMGHVAEALGVDLTEHGRKLALHVLRRHRLIEQFLVEFLGFDWSEVHQEAECLEHVVSDILQIGRAHV